MIRIYKSKDYNWLFDTITGKFNRWGKTYEDDPQFSPIGPEILDIEVSTICHQGCKFCYKNNTSIGKNMSYETFKTILDKIKGNLTQVAFGIGDLHSNPDLLSMMVYCRINNIVPNITINGLNIDLEWDHQTATQLAEVCGAVSVSNYNKDTCYNAVKMLTDAGLKQVNIHQLLSEETLGKCWALLVDIKHDKRLENLNATVFLSLKQRGRGINHHPVKKAVFDDLVSMLLRNKIRFGMDSCGANKLLSYIKDKPEYNDLIQYIEPCESTLFSSYISVDSRFYPCSFAEEGEGLDVVNCKDFIKDIWNHPTTIEWRNRLLSCNRNCPIYRI
jgi:MoaA/NifB/PqqE/SkfB family radical SAM enzyme